MSSQSGPPAKRSRKNEQTITLALRVAEEQAVKTLLAIQESQELILQQLELLNSRVSFLEEKLEDMKHVDDFISAYKNFNELKEKTSNAPLDLEEKSRTLFE